MFSYPEKVKIKEDKVKALSGGKARTVSGDTLYVQFMKLKEDGVTELMNGFSHVYDECKNTGDFYWTYFIPEKAEENHLPIERGKVYVSAFYVPHVYQSLVWAHQYPEIEFIVGGPGMADKGLWPRIHPPNWSGRSGLAEVELFNKSPNYSWNIEMPRVPRKTLCSFTINRACTWGKCIFCARTWQKEPREIYRYRDFNNTVENLRLPIEYYEPQLGRTIRKEWGVWLLSPSIYPSFIRDELWKLSTEGVWNYSMFIRGDEPTYEALKDTLDKCSPELRKKLSFRIGVEFPSDRMLRIMRKGTEVETILKTIELLKGYGCHVAICLILGWNVLTKEDVESAERFVERVDKDLTVAVFYLINNFSSNKEIVRKVNQAESRILSFTFRDLYEYELEVPILSPEQKVLNKRVRDLYADNFQIEEAIACREILGRG